MLVASTSEVGFNYSRRQPLANAATAATHQSAPQEVPARARGAAARSLSSDR